MKRDRIFLFSSLALALTACVGPDEMPYPPGAVGAPAPAPGYGPAPAPYPPVAEERPEYASEYRNGYDIGSQDRNYGYPQDARRAYDRFGRGFETYFREGYSDGFEGRPARR